MTVGIGLAAGVFIAAFLLGAYGSELRARLRKKLLETRLPQEDDPYFNREYARPESNDREQLRQTA